MRIHKQNLPELIYLNDYGGNFQLYMEAVYAIFERDLLRKRPKFGFYELSLKNNPLFQQRSYTFYHLTHKGEIEKERTPDFRCCERIGWVKPTIENVENWNLKFWEQSRNGKSRVCIQLSVEDDVDYFVILDVRVKCVIIWTAFVAEYEHEKRKKEKEYQNWVKENSGKTYVPDALISKIINDLKKQGSLFGDPVTPLTHGQ
jgi:hypothetical protein